MNQRNSSHRNNRSSTHAAASRLAPRLGAIPRAAAIEALESRRLLTWTPLANGAPAAIGTAMLLSDGTVMAQGAGVTNTWYKLTPSSTGSYVNGTWSTLASMSLQRLYFASNVMKDGRVFVLGGEYSGASGASNWTNTGEIYNPVTNAWTSIPNMPETQFGDVPSAMLPDGRVMVGSLTTANTYIYNPTTNAWSTGATKLAGDRSDEETWVKLPDDSILSYNIFGSSPQSSQRYNPSTNTWVSAGAVPVQLHTTGGAELGPALRMPDGRVIHIGGTNHNAIYTPPTTLTGTGSWVAAPDTPGGIGANDAAGAILPNGHVIYAAGDISTSFNPPTTLFEYDSTTNAITTLDMTNGPSLTSLRPYLTRMLALPTGETLFGNFTSVPYVYSESTGTVADAWRPTITGVASNGGGTYTLTGTQLNGISEGASYGDDAEMSTNFPVIRLTSTTGVVKYARSFNWSSTGVATGSTPVTTQFTLPSGITGGAYKIEVVASGIASKSSVIVLPNGGGLAAGATIKLDPTNLSNVGVFNSATLVGSFAISSIAGVILAGDSTANSFIVNDNLGDLPVYVSGGGGGDTLAVQSVQASGATWTIDGSHVTSSGRINLTYAADVGALAVTMDDAADVVNVTGTQVGVPITLNAGAGTDTINVVETAAAQPLSIVGSAGLDNVTVNGDLLGSAAVIFNGTQSLGALAVNPNGAAVMQDLATSQLLSVTSLSVSLNGYLDMVDNDLLYDYSGSAQQTAVRSLLSAGYFGGSWINRGLTSSAARTNSLHNTALGYLEASDYKTLYGPSATFDGQAIDTTAVVVRYTLAGDNDLDTTVGIGDFNLLAIHFGTSGQPWLNGDYDYDGGVSINDFNVLAINFGKSLATNSPAASTAVLKVPSVAAGAKPATLSGLLFNDVNRNGRYDRSDTLAAGKTVWLDFDDDGIKDANEPAVVTGKDGRFAFTKLALGKYHIRRLFAKGTKESTKPAYVTLAAGQVFSTVTIGSRTV